MDAELQPRVNRRVVLVHRDGVYVVALVLGVTVLGGACVLTYSFTSYGQLRSNADAVRKLIAFHTKVTDHTKSNSNMKVDAADAYSNTMKALVPASPRGEYGFRMGTQSPNRQDMTMIHAGNDTFAMVVSRNEAGTDQAEVNPQRR